VRLEFGRIKEKDKGWVGVDDLPVFTSASNFFLPVLALSKPTITIHSKLDLELGDGEFRGKCFTFLE